MLEPHSSPKGPLSTDRWRQASGPWVLVAWLLLGIALREGWFDQMPNLTAVLAGVREFLARLF